MPYDNTNEGAVWINTNKGNDKQPDLNGSLNVEGKEYWISGWNRAEGANPRSPVISLRIEEKQQRCNSSPKPTQPTGASFNDDIPF